MLASSLVGCKSITVRNVVDYVHEGDQRFVRPGEVVYGECVNTNAEPIWVFSIIGLKAAIDKGYTYEMLAPEK